MPEYYVGHQDASQYWRMSYVQTTGFIGKRGQAPPNNWSVDGVTREHCAVRLAAAAQTRTFGELGTLLGVSSEVIVEWLKNPLTLPKWAGLKIARLLPQEENYMNRVRTFLEQKKSPRKTLEIKVTLTPEQMDKMYKLAGEFGFSLPELARAGIDYFLTEAEKPL